MAPFLKKIRRAVKARLAKQRAARAPLLSVETKKESSPVLPFSARTTTKSQDGDYEDIETVKSAANSGASSSYSSDDGHSANEEAFSKEEEDCGGRIIAFVALLLLAGLAVLLAMMLPQRISKQDITVARGDTYFEDRPVLLYVPRTMIDEVNATIFSEGLETYNVSIPDYYTVEIGVDQVTVVEDEDLVIFNDITYNSSSYEVQCYSTEWYCRVYEEEDSYERRMLLPHPSGGSSSGGGSGGGNGGNGCFSHSATVAVPSPDGIKQKPMHRLQVGDLVMIGDGTFQPIYGFAHCHPGLKTEFVQLSLESSHEPLELTSNHLAYIDSAIDPVPASQLRLGQKLIRVDVAEDSKMTTTGSVIKAINKVTRIDGLYAPLTADGTIVVNDMLMSTYVSVQENSAHLHINGRRIASSHDLVHLWFTPMRLLCSSAPTIDFCTEQAVDTGFAPWLSIGEKILSTGLEQHAFVQYLILFGVVVLIGACVVLEFIANYSYASLSNLSAAWSLTSALAFATYVSTKTTGGAMPANFDEVSSSKSKTL